jgi:NAD(P)H-hydrate epimerase
MIDSSATTAVRSRLVIKIVTVEQMRVIEAAADAAGLSYAQMMENAGRAAAARLLTLLEQVTEPQSARVTILVGPGNNGGDGLVAGRILAEAGVEQVRFYLLKPRTDDDPNYAAVQQAGLLVANAEDDQRFRVLSNMIATSDLVVDALFGIGVSLPLRAEAAKLLRAVHNALNSVEAEPDSSLYEEPAGLPLTPAGRQRPLIVALDCPSGLNCDTGAIDKLTLPADETITFIAAKPGLLALPGLESVGRLFVAPIGVPPNLEPLAEASHALADVALIRSLLPERPAGSHKGTFGKVLIAGGSVNYTGAPGLAARAAYRVGAGLVTVGAPGPVVSALASQLLEATWLLLPHDMGVLSSDGAAMIHEQSARYDVLVLGPGWNTEKTTRELLLKLLTQPNTNQSARRQIGFAATATRDAEASASKDEHLPPLIIDADGLTLLSQIDDWPALLPPKTVLTPHPGEMARLTGLSVEDVQAKRWELAAEKAAEWKVVLVLKGAHTLIAGPDGQVTALPFKTSALATAGTGDVLAGAIAGMMAQGLGPYDAAVVGAYLHGLAGVMVADGYGSERVVMAGDVVDALIDALRSFDER